MDYLKDKVAELYGSEYPKGDKGSLKRLRLTKAVVGSLGKRRKIALKEKDLKFFNKHADEY